MRKLPLLAAVLLLAACAQTSSSPSPTPTPSSPSTPTPNVTGIWIGPATGGQTGQFKFVFSQTGNYVKGEAYTTSGSGADFQERGPIDGALNGNALLFTINVNTVESYSVSGTVSGTTYSGTATYKPGTSESVSTTFTVTRQ